MYIYCNNHCMKYNQQIKMIMTKAGPILPYPEEGGTLLWTSGQLCFIFLFSLLLSYVFNSSFKLFITRLFLACCDYIFHFITFKIWKSIIEKPLIYLWTMKQLWKTLGCFCQNFYRIFRLIWDNFYRILKELWKNIILRQSKQLLENFERTFKNF